MKIGINVTLLRKSYIGMGQVTMHALREIIRQEGGGSIFSQHEFFLYAEEDFEEDLPENFHKRIILPPWRRDDLVR